VFAIIGLVGMTALAIDGGRAYLERRRTQNAADTAALAGALARIEGKGWREVALASALENGFDNNGTTNTVELNTPPVNGPYSNDPQYIQVIVTSHMDTFFGPVVGIRRITVASQAISQTKPAEYSQMFDGYALVSLAPHSKCNNQRGFWIHEEASILFYGGGLFVNSDNPTCAYIQQGNGSIRMMEEGLPFSIVGGATIQNPRMHTPYPPDTGAIPMSYPPSYQMPKVGCGGRMAEVVGEEGDSMTPGNWDDDFPPQGVTHLESGIYCIGGDVLVESGEKLGGDKVVLVVDRGSVTFRGGASVQLSAPRSGDLQGLLIYMPMGNNSRLVLNGNFDSEFRGTILAPSAQVLLNGLDTDKGFKSQIIGYTIEAKGSDAIVINYQDDLNYDAYRMPEILLTE
jgi:hypothetical protein